MRLTHQNVYPRLKKAIASTIDGLDWSKLSGRSDFAEPPLQLNLLEKQALKAPINREFSRDRIRVTEIELNAAEKISDVANVILEKSNRKKEKKEWLILRRKPRLF